jgi:nucleoside-diphosphate-sugar epimerase
MIPPEAEKSSTWILNQGDPVLVTGAGGFIGGKVVELLVDYGFSKIRCFVRPSSNISILDKLPPDRLEVVRGNLLSREDCQRAVRGVGLILHLAAGIDKSFAGSFLNSVVATRNLIDAALTDGPLRRFVNVGSFAVYSTFKLRPGILFDESTPLETETAERFDAYSFAKLKQDELVTQYGREKNLPYVIVRPGVVYGPGVRQRITPRVGIDSFGFFLHLGGSNRIPLTYLDNCADAIIRAGLVPGLEGQVFNVVDDELPTSRWFLRSYKRRVRAFRSVYIPYPLFYLLCYLWEKYSKSSKGQIPPVFNRRRCSAYWKRVRYSNQRLKDLTGWQPRISSDDGLARYFTWLAAAGRETT